MKVVRGIASWLKNLTYVQAIATITLIVFVGSTFLVAPQPAEASAPLSFLFGRDVEKQIMTGVNFIPSYDGGYTEDGSLIPGSNLSVRLAVLDKYNKGVPLTFSYTTTGVDKSKMALPGMYVKASHGYILESISSGEIKQAKKHSQLPRIYTDEYTFRNIQPGVYTFVVGNGKFGRDKSGSSGINIVVGHPFKLTKSKVTRRVTEVALDKDGKEIEEEVAPVKEAKKTEQRHSVSPPVVQPTVVKSVTSGVVDVFGPAWMRVSTQIYNQSGHQVHDSGTGQEIGANGKLRFSDINPLPATVVVYGWIAGEWKEAGRLSLTQEKWFDSLSLEVEDRTWLSEAEMDRYLDLVKRLDQKQGTGVEAISHQRIACGEWIYWVQKPRETTAEDWKYLSSVREPRRRQQLLEMLALDVIHRGSGAFPYDKTLTAGWGYELAYQALTYMKPQWAIRDGAVFQKTFAPPLAPPTTVSVIVPPTPVLESAVEVTEHTDCVLSRPKPRTRVIVEEVEVEGYVSGAVQATGLGQSTTVRYHKPGLWDKIVAPVTSYVGRTRMSISSTGGSVGNVSSVSTSTGGAGGSVGNIDVSAKADAAATAAADAAAASESH